MAPVWGLGVKRGSVTEGVLRVGNCTHTEHIRLAQAVLLK